MQKVMYTVKSVFKECNSKGLIEGNRIQYFNIRYYRYSCYRLPSDTNILQELHSSDNYIHVIIIIIYLSWSWATCWPIPFSRIQKSLQGLTCFLMPVGE